MNKKTLIMAIGGVVLLSAAGGGGYFFARGSNGSEPEMAAAMEEEVVKEILYHPMTPEFIVNFSQPSGTQFLMLDLTVAVDDPMVLETIKKHTPAVRNNLLLLFSQHANEKLFSKEGKDTLRTLATEHVTELVKEHYPEGEIVDLLFTRFVMQ